MKYKPKRQVRNRLAVLLYQKELRDKRRVTQLELAKFLGVSENTITKWAYNDVTIMDTRIIEGLCTFFNCGICDLLYFDEISDYETEKG